MKRLIEIGVIPDVHSAPRGFELLDPNHLDLIFEETDTDKYIIVN